MENQKMTSGWKKWTIGTAITVGLIVLIEFIFPYEHMQAGQILDFQPNTMFKGIVALAWMIFNMKLIFSLDPKKISVRNVAIFVPVFILIVLLMLFVTYKANGY